MDEATLGVVTLNSSSLWSNRSLPQMKVQSMVSKCPGLAGTVLEFGPLAVPVASCLTQSALTLSLDLQRFHGGPKYM